MKLIDQSHEVWGECPTNLTETILWIERAGRVCYRSEDKIIEGSGKKFVDGIVKRKHYSVIEHSNLVVRTKDSITNPLSALNAAKLSFDSKYIDYAIENDRVYVGGNYRAWMECLNRPTIEDIFAHFTDNDWWEIVTKQYEIPNALKRITVEFVTDRAVTHELVRHRPVSYSQESQRYVRYDDITFIKPAWYDTASSTEQACFEIFCSGTEAYYKWFRVNAGMKAENARVVLSNCTATRIVVTTSLNEWNDVIFKLRCSKAALNQMRNLMVPTQAKFKEKGWI